MSVSKVEVDIVGNRKKGTSKNQKRVARSQKNKSVMGDYKIPEQLFSQSGTIYRFKRRGAATTITQQALVETLGSFQFTLSSTQGNTELTTLFDSYRIAFIEIELTPMYNMAAITTAANLITPNLYTAIDLDDNTAPASIAALQEYSTCRMTRFDKSQTRRFQPFFAKALYSGTFVSFGMGHDWVDCNSPTVQWYGMKYGIEAGATGQTNLQAWKVNFIYYIELKFSR